MVARNFSLLDERDWTWLSYDAFLSMLRAEYFQARSEMAVYTLVREYCAAHSDTLSSAQKRAALEEIRHRFFTLAQMEELARDPQFEATGACGAWVSFAGSPTRHDRFTVRRRVGAS